VNWDAVIGSGLGTSLGGAVLAGNRMFRGGSNAPPEVPPVPVGGPRLAISGPQLALPPPQLTLPAPSGASSSMEAAMQKAMQPTGAPPLEGVPPVTPAAGDIVPRGPASPTGVPPNVIAGQPPAPPPPTLEELRAATRTSPTLRTIPRIAPRGVRLHLS
jgi:hypothetical protein